MDQRITVSLPIRYPRTRPRPLCDDKSCASADDSNAVCFGLDEVCALIVKWETTSWYSFDQCILPYVVGRVSFNFLLCSLKSFCSTEYDFQMTCQHFIRSCRSVLIRFCALVLCCGVKTIVLCFGIVRSWRGGDVREDCFCNLWKRSCHIQCSFDSSDLSSKFLRADWSVRSV